MYSVYILELRDGSYYTGHTNNLEKRLKQHSTGIGSKYVRSRLPLKLIYTEQLETRSLAMKREYAIKKFDRKRKEDLILSS